MLREFERSSNELRVIFTTSRKISSIEIMLEGLDAGFISQANKMDCRISQRPISYSTSTTCGGSVCTISSRRMHLAIIFKRRQNGETTASFNVENNCFCLCVQPQRFSQAKLSDVVRDQHTTKLLASSLQERNPMSIKIINI